MCTFVLHLIYFHSTVFWGFLILASVVETYSSFDVTTTQAQHEYSEAFGKVHNPQCIWRIWAKYKPKSCLLILVIQVRCLGDVKMIGHDIPDAGEKMWMKLPGVRGQRGVQPGRHNSSGSSNTGPSVVIYRISAGLQCTPGHWHPAEI